MISNPMIISCCKKLHRWLFSVSGINKVNLLSVSYVTLIGFLIREPDRVPGGRVSPLSAALTFGFGGQATLRSSMRNCEWDVTLLGARFLQKTSNSSRHMFSILANAINNPGFPAVQIVQA